jgi:hypothetical protein
MPRLLFALPIALITVATPAAAAEPDAELAQVAETLQDPVTQDALADTLGALVAAMMDLKIGGIVSAAAKIDPAANAKPVDPNMTLGDMAGKDNPDFERKLDRDVRNGTHMLGAAAGAMAEMLPQLADLARDVEARVQDARARARRN